MPEWLTFSVAKDVLLGLVAAYGAILSTLNWRQAARKDRRTITVELGSAIPTYNDGRTGRSFARIQATNTGQRSVTITTLALELPGGARMVSMSPNGFPGMPDTSLPTTLSDGQSAFLYFSYEDIGGSLIRSGRTNTIKVTPVCEDSAGGIYRGEAWDVNPQEFARM